MRILKRFLIFMTLVLRGGTAPVLEWNIQCYNGRVNEFCAYGQFCSEDPVQRGCRNCTEEHFLSRWDDETRREEFRTKFPLCEVFLERKALQTLNLTMQDKLERQAKEINFLNQTVATLNAKVNKGDVFLWILGLAVFILAACFFGALCKLKKSRKECATLREQNGTAGMGTTQGCFGRKTRRPTQPGTGDEGDIANTAQLLSEVERGRQTPTAPIPVTDSGHASETSSLANDSNSQC